jgi:two-component system sensor histidine kinase KdpD
MGLGLSLVGLPVLTWATVASGLPGRRESILLVYLLAVVLIAVVGGLLPGFLAGVGGFLAANWFHTPPFATLNVGQPEALIDLVVFVLVAVVVSVVVEIGARDRARAEHHRLAIAREAARAEQLAETDRVRSALLTAVSHDLRTPIAAIKAAASGLRQGDVDWQPEQEAELLAAIEDGADGLAHLVDDLLAMSRIQAGALSVHPTALSVDEVVARALGDWNGDPVRLSIPATVPDVLADGPLVERVLANLLDNARRFNPPDRSVEISAVRSRTATGTPSVEIRVVDHGPGAPSDRWEQMFAPFQRLGDATPGGLGLGLAIARGLAEAMSGTVRPEATPGGGLTMCVELPAAP